MNGKKKKARKKAKSKGGEGVLSRFFKVGAKNKSANGKSVVKARAKPLTPLERSIQEIKHMAKVGESDPERLAMLLSRLLGQEKEKQRQSQEEFDRMVWDIVHKDDEAADADGAAENN